MEKVIDLDVTDGATVLLTYQGYRTGITRTRLMELLHREQDYLRLLALAGGSPPIGEGSAAPRAKPEGGAPLPAPIQEGGEPQDPQPLRFDENDLSRESISHASLSSRIKKVYTYSMGSKRLRPAHVSLLREIIEDFDWVFPRHPNSKLEQQLIEMVAWKGVPEDFRNFVMEFIGKYLKSRKQAG